MRERLNAFFGYPAVGAVKIVAHRIGAAPEKETKPSVERKIPPATEDRLNRVEGPLKDSLRALARGILARS